MPDDKKPRSRSAKDRINARGRLYRYLMRGGLLVRDEVGGAVGVAWARASRSGEAYPNNLVAPIMNRGCTIDGQSYALNKMDDGTYALRETPL